MFPACVWAVFEARARAAMRRWQERRQAAEAAAAAAAGTRTGGTASKTAGASLPSPSGAGGTDSGAPVDDLYTAFADRAGGGTHVRGACVTVL